MQILVVATSLQCERSTYYCFGASKILYEGEEMYTEVPTKSEK